MTPALAFECSLARIKPKVKQHAANFVILINMSSYS